MGFEATCRATLDGTSGRGQALLETTELRFSGDFKARVPLGEVESVKIAGKTLTLKWRGRVLALELGDAAGKWAEKIKNPPSRLQKLGVKPGMRVAMVGRFDFEPGFAAELEKAGATLAAATSRAPVDILFYALTAPPDLDRIAGLAKRLEPAGALWTLRPKGKDTPVTESETRGAGLRAGLVDVKVAAFSATHTAEKFVIPLAKRKG
jgi:hypothetical protein